MVICYYEAMDKTDQFSFIIKPSKDKGVGVFALHDIDADIWLALKPRGESVGIKLQRQDIPKELIGYCVANQDGTWNCPAEFNHMHMVWYLNHSDKPNAEKRADGYYAITRIKNGDEILIDYNSLDEPDDAKKAFYKK